MHTLQKLLITRLVKNNGISYSQLTHGYDSEDNIAFHLKQLISKKLVEKREKKYFLTPEGVKTLATFQKTDLQDNAFKMFFIGFVCHCNDSFLIKPHNNNKTTFYNLPSGSPLFGEPLEDALERIFYEETDIHVPSEMFEFDSIHMKTTKTSEKEVIFDDAFCVYKVSVSEKQKNKMQLKKGGIWMGKNELTSLQNLHPEITICILKKDWELYNVYDVISDYVLK